MGVTVPPATPGFGDTGTGGHFAANAANAVSPEPQPSAAPTAPAIPSPPSPRRQNSLCTTLTRVLSPAAVNVTATRDAFSTSVSSCQVPEIIQAKVKPAGGSHSVT